MIMQAYEYEKKAKKGMIFQLIYFFFYFLREINISFLFTIPGPFLQSFFDSTKGVFKTPQVQAWDKRLRDIRNQLFLNV